MKPNYLELSKIKPSDRTFLIDWIVKIHKSSKLSHKCLFLSVVTIDRFLQVRVSFYCTIWLSMLTITHFVCFRLMLISWNVIYNLLAWLHCAHVFSSVWLFGRRINPHGQSHSRGLRIDIISSTLFCVASSSFLGKFHRISQACSRLGKL